jgi:hypothetical protein
LASDKEPPKERIKVTDKRIFTPEGEIRDEFRGSITPVEPDLKPSEARSEKTAEKPPDKAAEKAPPNRPAPPPQERRQQKADAGPQGERRRTMADKAVSPGTAFADFIEPLIAQAYMSLGMLRNPYQAKSQVDVGAARQMIEILTMLQQKTAGNLTPEEEDFLSTHLGELKLAFVQRTKSL